MISSGGGSNDYYTVNSKTGYTLSGGSGPEAGGSIWRPTMLKVLPLLPKTEFVRPKDSPYRLSLIHI